MEALDSWKTHLCRSCRTLPLPCIQCILTYSSTSMSETSKCCLKLSLEAHTRCFALSTLWLWDPKPLLFQKYQNQYHNCFYNMRKVPNLTLNTPVTAKMSLQTNIYICIYIYIIIYIYLYIHVHAYVYMHIHVGMGS